MLFTPNSSSSLRDQGHSSFRHRGNGKRHGNISPSLADTDVSGRGNLQGTRVRELRRMEEPYCDLSEGRPGEHRGSFIPECNADNMPDGESWIDISAATSPSGNYKRNLVTAQGRRNSEKTVRKRKRATVELDQHKQLRTESSPPKERKRREGSWKTDAIDSARGVESGRAFAFASQPDMRLVRRPASDRRRLSSSDRLSIRDFFKL